MHDDHTPPPDPKNENEAAITPALEARIVAWVLGEASAFEIAELERLVSENPALAIFKRRIEAVHGLVGEAERPVEPALKLSAERRANLLKVIGGEANPASTPSSNSVVIPIPSAKRHKAGWFTYSAAFAACAAIAITIALSPSERKSRMGLQLPPAESVAQTAGHAESDLKTKAESPVANFASIGTGSSLPTTTGAGARFEFHQEKKTSAYISSLETRPALRAADESAAKAAPAFSAAPEPVALDYAGSGISNARTQIDLDLKEQIRPAPAAPVTTGGITYGVSAPAFADARGGAGGGGGSNTRIANRPVSGTGSIAPNAPPPAGFGGGGGRLEFNRLGSDVSGPTETVRWNMPLVALDETKAVDGNLRRESGLITNKDDFAARAVSASGLTVSTIQENEFIGGRSVETTRSLAPSARAGWGNLVITGGGSVSVGAQGVTIHGGTAPITPGKESAIELVDLNAFQVATDKDAAPARARAAEPADPATRPAAAVAVAGTFRDVAAKKTAEPDLPLTRTPRAIDEALRAEIPTSTQAVSTFSLHVSDVSYRLARAAIARGERPEAASIRPEEFYNAFDYGDPAPVSGETVAARIEQAAHPFLQQRNLVRVALKVPATGRSAAQPLRLTVLLDTSGSMERDDRVASVRRAFDVLASLLGPNDRITLIGFARTPRLLAERLPGDQAKTLNDIIRRTPAEGGTNLEEALKLAGEHARRDFTTGAQNRIVLLTDGAANLGSADPVQLAAAISALRQQGIAFDACGVGLNGLDDSVLEALTRKGDGRYYAINSPEEADTQFARQLAGAFRPAARDVKVQVRFNPARVRAQRLVGFEQHRLREEDFRNNAVDAAELAAEEAANALYQVEVLPEGEGELGEVFVRFRRADTGEIVERKWTLAYQAQPAAFDRATPSLRLAGSAALLAEKLRGGPVAGPIRLSELAPVVDSLRTAYPRDARVRDFITMFSSARRLVGE